MNVANIIEDARIGGPQIRNLKVANELKKKIRITLIFPNKNSKTLKKKCNFFGIKYLSLPLTTIKRGLIGISLYVILFPFEVIMLSYVLKKNNFNLVHVSGGCWQSKGVLAAKLARINVIWELNDTYSPIIVRYFFFFLSHLANTFIFASESTKKYYKKFIPQKKKYFIIQSPVDINFFNPNLNYKIDKLLNKIFDERKIIIGTVANVNPVKNLKMLVNAAKKLSDYSNKIIFIVVGPIYASQKKYYENLINTIKNLNIKNFFFLNSRDDVRPLLNSVDIYVCTSKNESSPLSVWEAMSMEKAIVSTDVGDVKKFINHDVNGLIVKVNNTNNLAKNIKKLIKNKKLRKKFGKKSRQIVQKKLDIKMCVKLHDAAYRATTNYSR